MMNKILIKTYRKKIIALALALVIVFPLMAVKGDNADIGIGLSGADALDSGVLLGASTDEEDESVDTGIGLSLGEVIEEPPQPLLELNYAKAALDTAVPVTGYDELLAAVENPAVNAVSIKADFYIPNTVEIYRDFAIYGNGYTLTSGPDISMFHILGGMYQNVTFNNVNFIGNTGTRAILSTADKATLIVSDSYFEGFNRVDVENQEDFADLIGGAVLLAGGNHYLYGNTFSYNKAVAGGAVASIESIHVVMEGNTFNGNGEKFETDMGGAVALMDVFEASFNGDHFTDNQATSGGVGYIGGGMLATTTFLKDVEVTHNGASVNGGAFFISIESDSKSTVAISGGNISYNAAKRGGAVYVLANSMENLEFLVDGTTFERNQAMEFGGAIDMHPVDMKIDNAIFSGNEADRGGAIALITPNGAERQMSINGTTFMGNRAGNFGGAIYADNYSWPTDVKLSDSIFEGNDAGFSGGGLFMGMQTNVYISDGRFSNNIASDNGGAISVAIPGEMHYQQPGDRENLYIDGTAFEGNRAGASPQWLIKTLEPELARLQDEGINVRNLASLSKPFDARFNYVYNNYDVSFFGSQKVSGVLEHRLSNVTPFPEDTFQLNLYSTNQPNNEGDQRNMQLDAQYNRTEEMENYFVVGQTYVLLWAPEFEGYVAERVIVDFGGGNYLSLIPKINADGQTQVTFKVPNGAVQTNIIWNSRYVGFNMAVEMKLLPNSAQHDPTKPFSVIISRDSNGTVLFDGVVEPDEGVVVNRFMPGQSYKVTEFIANPEYNLKEMTIEAPGGEIHKSSEDSYSFVAKSEYSDSTLLITNALSAQVEILKVPDLEFGSLKIPGNKKAFELKTDSVLEVQGVQGEGWYITTKASDLVDTARNNVISASALKYVDNSGAHSMDIPQNVWLESRNAETQVYKKNFKSLDEGSIVLEVGPEIVSGEYKGTVTWTLVVGV